MIMKLPALLCVPRHLLYRNNYTTFSKMLRVSQEKIYKVLEPKAIDIARQSLLDGEVIALPTDTVYGFACDANNEDAIKKLYDIKGRESYKPVAICVKNLESFRRYGVSEHLNDTLLNRLLPGPVTIVIERSIHLSNRFLNPGTTKIGIRIPMFSFIKNLCSVLDDKPLALTSANRSAERSSLNINEFEPLWPKLGGIFDAGQIGLSEDRRSGSTVIDLSQPGVYKIVREGVALKVTLDLLKEFNIRLIDDNF